MALTAGSSTAAPRQQTKPKQATTVKKTTPTAARTQQAKKSQNTKPQTAKPQTPKPGNAKPAAKKPAAGKPQAARQPAAKPRPAARPRSAPASTSSLASRGSRGALPGVETRLSEEQLIQEALIRRRLMAQQDGDSADSFAVEVEEDELPWMDPAGMEGAQLALARQGAGAVDNEDLIREALRNRGRPYVWGGASRGGFDCSGFVCYVFLKQRGMRLPHSAAAQAKLGSPVGRDRLEPGDLVFFSTYRAGISHVGIYLGDNQFIHAANRRKDVRIDSLDGYYDRRYRGARRLSGKPIHLSREDMETLMQDSSMVPEGP
jgi:cell wall-associated NlpC family hydrolase